MFFSASPPGEPPAPDVAFAWGSRSTRRVAFSITAREAARLTAVVVFPTPPFWLATAMTWTKPRSSKAWQTRVIFKKINGLFYHAGACGRNENLAAVPWLPQPGGGHFCAGSFFCLTGQGSPGSPGSPCPKEARTGRCGPGWSSVTTTDPSSGASPSSPPSRGPPSRENAPPERGAGGEAGPSPPPGRGPRGRCARTARGRADSALPACPEPLPRWEGRGYGGRATGTRTFSPRTPGGRRLTREGQPPGGSRGNRPPTRSPGSGLGTGETATGAG